MNRTANEKFTLLFETAKKSLLASEAMLLRVKGEVAALEDDLLHGVDTGERAVSPLLDSISFIDFAHRFGHIFCALPLLKRKSPELLRLKAALAGIDEARNYLQHLRESSELSSNSAIEFPVFGSLSWTHDDASFTVAFAQSSPTVNLISPAFDTVHQRWTASYEYRVKDTRVDLEDVLREMRLAYDWLTAKITSADLSFTALSWGVIQAFCFRMTISVSDITDGGPDAKDSD